MGRRRHREHEEQRGGRRTRLDLWTHEDEPVRAPAAKPSGAAADELAGSVGSTVGQQVPATDAAGAGGGRAVGAPAVEVSASAAPSRLLALLGGYSDDGDDADSDRDIDRDSDRDSDGEEAGHAGANGWPHKAAGATAHKPARVVDGRGSSGSFRGGMSADAPHGHPSNVATAGSHRVLEPTAVSAGKERSPLPGGLSQYGVDTGDEEGPTGRPQHGSAPSGPALAQGHAAGAVQGVDELDEKVADFLNELKGSGLLDESQGGEEELQEGGGEAGSSGSEPTEGSGRDAAASASAPSDTGGPSIARAGTGGDAAGPGQAGLAPPGRALRLPKPWTKVKDESSGDFYYWNMDTGETSWDAPPLVEEAAAVTVAPRVAADELPGEAAQGAVAGRDDVEDAAVDGVAGVDGATTGHSKVDAGKADGMPGRLATAGTDRAKGRRDEAEGGEEAGHRAKSPELGTFSGDEEEEEQALGARRPSPDSSPKEDVEADGPGRGVPPLGAAGGPSARSGCDAAAVVSAWQDLEAAGQDLGARLQYIEEQAPSSAKQPPSPALRLCRRMVAEMRLRLGDLARLQAWVEDRPLLAPDDADNLPGREDGGASPGGDNACQGRRRDEVDGLSAATEEREGGADSRHSGGRAQRGGGHEGQGVALCLDLIRWLQDTALSRLHQMAAEAWVLQEEVLTPDPASAPVASPRPGREQCGAARRTREGEASPSSPSRSMSSSSPSSSSMELDEGSEEGEVIRHETSVAGTGASIHRSGTVLVPSAHGAAEASRRVASPGLEGPPGVDYPVPPPDGDLPYPPLPEVPGLPPPPEDEDVPPPPPPPPEESWYANTYVPPVPAIYDPSAVAAYPAVPGYGASAYAAAGMLPTAADASTVMVMGMAALPAALYDPTMGTPYATQQGDVLAGGGLSEVPTSYLSTQPTVLVAAASPAGPLQQVGHASMAAPSVVSGIAAGSQGQAARGEGGSMAAPVPRVSSSGALAPATKEKSKKKAGTAASVSVAPVGKSLGQSKKMSALLGKWKAAREEFEGEDKAEEAPMDVAALERKKQQELERWRLEQLKSGEAESNANFAPLNQAIDWWVGDEGVRGMRRPGGWAHVLVTVVVRALRRWAMLWWQMTAHGGLPKEPCGKLEPCGLRPATVGPGISRFSDCGVPLLWCPAAKVLLLFGQPSFLWHRVTLLAINGDY
eukprot:jgi/Mesvir1/20356/Mv19941-RA.2